MIGKKMLMWIGAGLLSVATIPAIGATLSHRAKLHAVKPVSHGFTLIHHKAKPSVKLVSHAKRASLTARHAKKHAHTKLTMKKTATHTGMGVLAMHSGHAKLVKHTAPAKRVAGHLLAAISKVKTVH